MSVRDDDLSDLERQMRAKLFAEKGVQNADTLSEDERRIARKLIGSKGPQRVGGLSQEEAKIAERIVGHDNLRRITSAKEGRRVHVAPVRTSYEWYWYKFGGGFYAGEIWSWRINRLENGRRFEHRDGRDCGDLDAEIAALKAKGFTVVESQTDNGRQNRKQPATSARKATLNELRFFRR